MRQRPAHCPVSLIPTPSRAFCCTFCCGRGILINGANNYIARNTCSNNTLNWSVVANNACLVVAATLAGAISGNNGGLSPGATNPHANFTV